MTDTLFSCPRCRRGKLFAGLLTLSNQCSDCGLSFAGQEKGDGPAFFGILIIGTLAAIGAAIVEIKFAPSFWLHAALWIPFIIVGSLACLRYGKAMLIHAQYRVKPWEFD